VGAAEALGGLVEYERSGSIRIAEYVAIPQPYQPPALCFEIGGALGIVRRLIVMLTAIDLDGQFRLSVSEADDVEVIDRKLPSESWTVA